MSKQLYFECESGISGDMIVASLLDAGASESVLREVLDDLPISGFEIKISRTKKSGLDACDFNVVLDVDHDGRDHDMDYLYGHESDQPEMAPVLHYDHPHHEHRGMKEITSIIEGSSASESAKKIALKVFSCLALAESKAHGVSIDEVHFHEVGAIDSIVDVLSAAVCLDDLGVEEVIVTGLREGTGTVRCQHGIIPVPVPAVLNIVMEAGIPLSLMNVRGEHVTPTGAAFVAATRTRGSLPSQVRILSVGIGAGKRATSLSGVLRSWVIESVEE